MELELIALRPESPSRPNPILFVHGMWHGAWCWEEHFLPYFAESGYECHALSVRGHGKSEGPKSIRWTSISDYVSDVEDIVGKIGGAPILVGHSMGGFVLQKYLESHDAPAAVLLAPAPPGGVLSTVFRIILRRPWAFIKANLTLSMYPIVETHELAREAFFSSDTPEEQLQRYFEKLQNDSYRAFLDMLVLDLPKTKRIKTPILVLGAENDTIFSRGQLESTAKAYNTQAHVFPGTAHDMMLESTWRDAADKIITWLSEQGK